MLLISNSLIFSGNAVHISNDDLFLNTHEQRTFFPVDLWVSREVLYNVDPNISKCLMLALDQCARGVVYKKNQ